MSGQQSGHVQIPTERRFGAFTVIGGALLLVSYAALFPFVLPIGGAEFDYVTVVASPWWRPLSGAAMVGVVLLLVGLDSVYSAFRNTTGIAAWLGFIALKVALVLQACKVTWQLLLDPAIARQPAAQFLIRDGIIAEEPLVVAFYWTAAATIVVGVALFGTALYRSGVVSRLAAALIAIGAAAYAAGLLFSMYVAVAGTITLGFGCLLIGRSLSRTPA